MNFEPLSLSTQTCWGPNAHGMKSASGKMAKQAALAFVKRTLGRCQEFEVSGKSCFNEPLFRDMFLSGVSRLADSRTMDSVADGEFGKIQGNTSSSLNEVRASGISFSKAALILTVQRMVLRLNACVI